jgi:pimeloyl-ACP methyl ester carboxylesterase
MRYVQRALLIIAFSAIAAVPASAAVFQYAVPVATAKAPSQAFLWIPADAEQVRGAVLAGMTLMEREFVKDVRIRQACADQQLAIVFLKCGLVGPDLQKVLDDLAKVSGYRELSAAPLFFVGHSAGGPQAKECAVKMAGRCFGLVQYRGGVPGDGDAVPPGLPALMMIGQFDEFGGTMRNEAGRETWERGRDLLAEFRAKDERHLASVVVEPGAGHFAWSDRNAAYLAMFIRKAAQARIPATRPTDAAKPVTLKAIDPHGGWLTDLTIKAAGEFEPAPYEKYRGDKTKAAWHFDKEMAEATVAYHAGAFGKQDQFIKWNDPYWVDAGARFFFTNLKWVGDGQTLEVHPAYADKYPSPQPNDGGPRWAQAGKPAGHSAAPILVKQVSGPMVAAGPNTLRIQYDNLAPAAEGSRVTFLAYSIGDAEYRYTEQVGMMPRGFAGLTGGKDQTITFTPIGNLKVKGAPVELRATSDAGLPVEYYVACGPAVMVEGKLKISELPVRAIYPIAVKVVAWQFGSGVAPLVKTAKPVEQTVLIEAAP